MSKQIDTIVSSRQIVSRRLRIAKAGNAETSPIAVAPAVAESPREQAKIDGSNFQYVSLREFWHGRHLLIG